MQSTLPLTWQHIEEDVNRIYLHATTLTTAISGIYGVPRGGLIPAIMLSHRLNFPLLSAPAAGCIIIDDIADTGKTLEQFGRYNNGPALIATLVHKKSCGFSSPVYFSARIIDTDAWVIFPWEA
jgi:hypoxanthine phosphoribosyltransferase